MSRKEALLGMRQVLVRRRDALRKALAGDMSLLRDWNADHSGDLVDFAMDSASDEINSQIVEVESRELGQIDDALARFDEGQYGICVECDKPIPLSRLQALPYAVHCIECKRKQESRGSGHMFGNLHRGNLHSEMPAGDFE